jgi:hypothetical protein
MTQELFFCLFARKPLYACPLRASVTPERLCDGQRPALEGLRPTS